MSDTPADPGAPPATAKPLAPTPLAGFSTMPGSIFLVVAPSGAGKSTLVNALLARDAQLQLSISYTTRPPRPSEQQDREYHFVSVDEFMARRDRGEFLESAEVHGNYYATSRSWIERQIQAGTDVLLEIDWQGARQVKVLFPTAIGIFIVPPSIEALEARLHNRGQDPPAVIIRRVLAAGSEFAHAAEFEFIIINKDFEQALLQMSQIVAAARLRFAQQSARHKSLFAELGISS